ncbi:hypothetical protein M9H77_20936 [Catharanthus roseus]|uniref:Uncharacterized protein n=1 Tax=Catharanthus roseus TaxID=4058 RepID=A0ACC0AQA4_CATRO|nr:hypothetical protein M9H77_20936 [Catharanthus roseus]
MFGRGIPSKNPPDDNRSFTSLLLFQRVSVPMMISISISVAKLGACGHHSWIGCVAWRISFRNCQSRNLFRLQVALGFPDVLFLFCCKCLYCWPFEPKSHPSQKKHYSDHLQQV